LSKKKTATTGIKIKGTVLVGQPIHFDAPYAVYVGYMASDQANDIPHYLIVNTTYNVIEGSAARITDARLGAYQLARELEEQDKVIKSKGKLAPQQDSYGKVSYQ